MKIAVVSHACDVHSGSRAPIEIAKQFKKLGHDVSFFAYKHLSSKEAIRQIKSATIDLVLIDSPKVKFLGSLLNSINLSKELKKINPDFISAHATLPFLLGCKISGIPIYMTYHGTQQDVWLDKIFPKKATHLDNIINNFLNFLIRQIMRLQLSFADQIITLSSYCSKEIKSLYRKKALFIYWGSAPPHLYRAPKAREGEKLKLLSVSRIVPYKGFHILFSIVKEITVPLELVIIGSHPDKKYLTYLKRIKPKNTTIIVDPSDSVLSKYYQKTDIYLSADKFLFFGEPVLEAAEFGVPTIAFNYASASEIINNGITGYVVKTKEEFNTALQKLISSKVQREKMGANAKKLASTLTWEKSAKTYLEIFNKWQKT